MGSQFQQEVALSSLIPRRQDGTIDVHALPLEWKRTRLLRLIEIEPKLLETMIMNPQTLEFINILQKK